jgi:moderate conductance mechanosensitive channel
MPDFGAPPWSDWAPLFRQTIGPILLIAALAFVAIRGVRLLVHGLVRALSERGSVNALSAAEIAKRRDTIGTLMSRVLQTFIFIIAVLMVLHVLGLDIGPAVAGFGVVGIAVGFGAQSLVRDYFNGALILLENQYSIGDVVSLAGVTGTVEDLTLRRTTLRDLDGVLHTVPNGEIKVASNRTRGNGAAPPPPTPRPPVRRPAARTPRRRG